MEQATNLFSKGLLSDSHPMILGNDTLTDCLNGTLVTMNGNELVLQNDMGNRRIDHANLPEGYEPVGIKEYGGIIYIACYNPITNRGLIGSFPSPERRKGTEYSGLETSLNLKREFIEKVNNQLVIKKKTLLSPLTKEFTLHAGDLFKLSFDNDFDENIIKFITKQDNRNSLFTLRVGILNSQNEFVDITEDLKQYNIGSDEHPINYFISLPGLNQLELSYTTIDDETFIKNRLADLNVNTYSYKIVSPLYLQTTINTFTRTDVSCYAEIKNKNNDKYTCDFELTVNYEHDCLFNKTYKPLISIDGNYINKDNISISQADSKFETITSEVVYTFEVENLNRNIKLKIEFPLIHNYLNNYFYENDSIIVDTLEFDLDLEKVGSDTIEFNGYKYYNYDNYTNLRLDLTTYPKRKNSKLKNLYIELLDNNGEFVDRIKIHDGNIPSGITEFTFNFDEEYIRKYLKLNIYYGVDEEHLILLNENPLMYITTELFNDNYNGIEQFDDNDIENYDYSVHRYAKIDDYRKIVKIILTPTVDITSKTCTISSTHNSESTGDLNDVTLTETTENLWELKLTPTIYDKELYPEINIWSDISGSDESYFDSTKRKTRIYVNDILKNSDDWNTLLNSIKKIKGNLDQSTDDIINIDFKDVAESQGNFQFVVEEKVNNFWKSSTSKKDISILNLISSFSKFLENNPYLYDILLPYFCIDGDNNGDTHYFEALYSYKPCDTNDTSRFDTQSTKIRLSKWEYSNSEEQGYLINESLIDSFITSVTDNLFIGEYNTFDSFKLNLDKTDYIDSNITDGNPRNKFRRIWMRYGQNNYIPVGIYQINNTETPYDFSNNMNSLKLKIKDLPHLYVYNPNPQLFNLKIADFKDAIYSTEFDYPVKLELEETFDENVQFIIDNSYNIFELKATENLTPVIITLNLSNVKSNEKFIDILELIKSNLIECAYVDNDEIKIFDENGDLLDTKYVYKKDSGSIVKSYIPQHKFSIGSFLIPYLWANIHVNKVFTLYDNTTWLPLYTDIMMIFSISDIYNIPPIKTS